MPGNPPQPGSSADWPRYARSDLALGRGTPPPGVLLETLCFHLQQASEYGEWLLDVGEGARRRLKGCLRHLGRQRRNLPDLP